jgi:hypothetical protein
MPRTKELPVLSSAFLEAATTKVRIHSSWSADVPREGEIVPMPMAEGTLLLSGVSP